MSAAVFIVSSAGYAPLSPIFSVGEGAYPFKASYARDIPNDPASRENQLGRMMALSVATLHAVLMLKETAACVPGVESGSLAMSAPDDRLLDMPAGAPYDWVSR